MHQHQQQHRGPYLPLQAALLVSVVLILLIGCFSISNLFANGDKSVPAAKNALSFTDLSLIFGPQERRLASWDYKSVELKGSEITAVVVHGRDLEKVLKKSKNKIRTIMQGNLITLEKPPAWLDESRKYLVVQASLQVQRKRIPYIRVQIENGPLEKVTVGLRGMEAWDHNKNPLQSVFALPRDLKIEPGTFEAKVTKLMTK